MDGGLRHAAEGHESAAGYEGAQPAGLVEADPVAAEQHHAQTVAESFALPGGHQQVQQGGHALHQRHTVLAHQACPVVGVAALVLADCHDLSAERQRGEDVPGGEVEVERGDRQGAVGGAEAELLLHRLDRVDDRAVRHLDALGQPRGSGREQHVGGQGGIRLNHGGVLPRLGVLQEEYRGRGHPLAERPVLPVGEHGGGVGHGVDACAAYGGLLDADGGVRGARSEDAEDGGDLVGALGQGQRDGVALPDAVLAQERGDPARAV